MKRTLYSGIAVLALMLGGCSSTSTVPAAKKEVKAAVPIGGQSGIFFMYSAARQWKSDAQILSVENVNLDSVKPADGKYGAWRATFVSLTAKSQKVFTYGVVEEGAIRKGIYGGNEVTYAPKPLVRVIPIQKVKVDTPAALETAGKELKAVIEKNPEAPVQFIMEWTQLTMNPVWRVVIGPSVSQSLGSVYVDADTGKIVKKMR
jgi:hypothetical protein